jgi:hypothetical protein
LHHAAHHTVRISYEGSTRVRRVRWKV